MIVFEVVISFQTDLYGLAGSIYCVLFYDYMKVIKKGTTWQLSQKIPRYVSSFALLKTV